MRYFLSLKLFSSLFVLIGTGGCVSIDFKSQPPQKSENVNFNTPSKAYEEVSSRHLDRSWRNNKTGASISYLSECQSAIDPSLENIFKGITSEISSVAVIDSHFVDYNSREALHAQVEGKVDGVDTRFELMIFKKNNCTFILTYASKSEAFSSGQREFRAFVKGFVVP